MADEGFKRKLAAILSADVEGYSRLMDDDEEATVRTLTSYRTAIADLVQQFRGRVVDAPGDNILADFTSVVDAVNCAVEIQRELAERNAELPYDRRMEFRIGINLGDVIEEEGRIYGDGVNIAARVESMAVAGGICISGRAYDPAPLTASTTTFSLALLILTRLIISSFKTCLICLSIQLLSNSRFPSFL